MCGITGYKLLDEDVPQEAAEGAVKLFQQLLLESEIRGRHATGVAWVEDGKVFALKKLMPASEFLSNTEWKYRNTTRPTEMIGHTRYSTSGDPTKWINAQPLNNRMLALIHNGVVSMATPEEYCAEYRVQAATDNDSEIILRKILDETTWHGMAEKIAAVLKDVEPIYAVALLDNNGDVYLAHDEIRPLWMFWISEWNMMGFASTKDIIHRALMAQGRELSTVTIYQLPPHKVFRLGLDMARSAVPVLLNRTAPAPYTRPTYPVFDAIATGNTALPSRYEALDTSVLDPDDKIDYRADIRETFKQYCAAAVGTYEIDPNYPLLSYLFDRFELSLSQQYWACYLYGVFYHPGTVFYVMQEFPDYEKVDLGRLKRWHALNWKQLRYNTDRKYEKGHFVEMFESYVALIGSQDKNSQDKFFRGLLTPDPVNSFHAVFTTLQKLVRFGRYSTYIYTEALARCMGMPLDADTMFLKEAKSSRTGLAIVLGVDPERIGNNKPPLTSEQWRMLFASAEMLLNELKEEYPELKMDYWFMESCLCAFKGYFRQTKGRYLPFYTDRMADEIRQMAEEKVLTAGIDWRVLWQFRYECLPHEYLGEMMKPERFKVERRWEHVLRDTGRMIGLEAAIQRGIVKAKVKA